MKTLKDAKVGETVTVAKLHDQHDHDGGADARQRNMQALLPAIGTIDLGSLVQFRIDVRDGGYSNPTK